MNPVHLALLLSSSALIAACPDPPAGGPEVELPDTGLQVRPDGSATDGFDTFDSFGPPDSAPDEPPDMEVTVLACAPGAADSACDDLNACTDDGCDSTGRCFHIPNIAQCDDGDGCTVFDRCEGGSCQGTAKDCDDGSACTTDTCRDGSCEHGEVVGPCDDADECTGGDHCEAGSCIGSAVECPGAGPCRTATCDPRTGCRLTDAEDGWSCDDGNACTENTVCAAGECRGSLVACDDGDPCSDDHCQTDVGCSHRDNHVACDDGDRCSSDDRCAAGVCAGSAVASCCVEDCDDGNACTRDSCEAGVCAHAPAADLPPEGQVIADFEGQADGWSLASTNGRVGWHLDTSWAASGTGSLYCGAADAYGYDRGATLARAATRILVPPVGAELHLVVKADVDGLGSCIYDALRVLVDGTPVGLVCGSGEGEHSFSLAAFGGREAELELVFDTVDELDNAGLGLWVDRVRLTAAPCGQVPVVEP